MALTRKMLKAMGIEEEKIEQIIEAHTETVDGLKGEVARYKPDAEKLSSVQQELDGLKAAGDGGYKAKYEQEHSDFEAFKQAQAAKDTRAAKEKAYRALLKAVGVGENRLEKVLKLCDVDGVELDEQGNIVDADALKGTLSTEWADFIVTTETQGANMANPPHSGGGDPAEPGSLAEALKQQYEKKG